MNWDAYPNFQKAEFDCQHSGRNEMRPEFMSVLQAIRTEYGKPMRVTSGYRHHTHPIEARKKKPGEHSLGTCADIACTDSADRYELIRIAIKHGITRIGIAGRFLHLGIGGEGLATPAVWDYR
jgi:uncharacterized protein YcbK (DUF882 family)